MVITQLALRNFRNIKSAQMRPHPRLNVLVGGNGQGKTNLLEAISLLIRGESFRQTLNSHLIQKGAKPIAGLGAEAFVSADFKTHEVINRIDIVFHNRAFESGAAAGDTGRKTRYRDRKLCRSTHATHDLPAVVFSPDSLEFIKGSSEQRRLLVDKALGLFDFRYQSLLRRYKRCLQSRNRLLKSVFQGELSQTDFDNIIAAVNEIFFNLGMEITWSRIQFLKGLSEHFKDSCYCLLSREPVGLEDVSIDYLTSDQSVWNYDPPAIREVLSNRAHELRRAEMAAGSSLVGPHKHKIEFFLNGLNSRFYCSQGQQRAFILSFKLAEMMYYYHTYQSYPMLLLDDVMSELDEGCRKRLFVFLGRMNSQVFLTTTETDSINLLSDHGGFFKMKDGKISEFVAAKNGSEDEAW